MARLATTGRGSRHFRAGVPLRTVSILQHCGTPPQRIAIYSAYSYGRFALLFLMGLGFLVGNGMPAWAQNQDTQVHIQPRVEKDKPDAEDGVDPALRTHTRPYKVDVDLVLIPVTITDPMNRLVTGLEKDNFEVFDDDKKQVIQHFSSEDSPISMGVIFDVSGSMSDKMEKAREAVVEFSAPPTPMTSFS